MTPSNLIGFKARGRASQTPPAPPSGPRHAVTRIDSTRGRYYDVTDTETGEVARVPSVTHVLDKGLPKGAALQRWIANTDRQAALDAAADLNAELAGHPQLPRALYLAALAEKLGKARASEKTRDAAGLVGSAAHAWVAWDLKRRSGIVGEQEPVLSVPAQHAIDGYLQWRKDHTVEPIAVEQVVYSLRYGLAGTLDCFARIDGVPTVLDLKTGKGVYPEALLQTGFYAYGLLEMGVVQTLPAGLVLRLPKRTTDPVFETVAAPTRDAMPIVLAARAIWAWGEAQEALYREKKAGEKATPMRTAAEPLEAVGAAVPLKAVAVRGAGMAAQSGRTPLPLTHYSPHSGRQVASVCGVWLEAPAVTTSPTCPDCARYVETVNLDEPPF